MITLNEQIRLLEEELQLNQKTDDAQYILGEYEAIREPFNKVDEQLTTLFNRSFVLQELPENAPQRMSFSKEVREEAKSALFALRSFTQRWETEGHESRQGNNLTLTTESLNSLVKSGSAEVENCWRAWVESLESLVALEDLLLDSQKDIPGLKATYDTFVKTRIQFRELVAQFPEDVGDIEKLQQLSEKLLQLKEKMQFDLPEEVTRFFKQLDNINRKVSLSAMTPEVFEWLRSRNLLDAYVVSRRGHY